MIEKRLAGSLFECGADYLVNPVNCLGTMGKGLAKVFKIKFPLMYRDYQKACALRQVRLGAVSFWHNPDCLSHVRVIVNFPTKDNWKGKSKLSSIDDGLLDLKTKLKTSAVTCLAIPALGCGEGGLDFEEVFPLIEKHLSSSKISVIVFSPQ